MSKPLKDIFKKITILLAILLWDISYTGKTAIMGILLLEKARRK